MKHDAAHAKREEVMARAKVLRSVPGSGYHDNDLTGPVKSGEPAIDEHCIAFRQPFEMLMVGPCVARALAAIRHYATEHEPLLRESRLDPETRLLIETAVEYAAVPDGDLLLVRSAQWNTVLAVLHAEKVGVTCTSW